MLLAPHLPKSRLDHEVGQAFLVPDIELDIGGVLQRAGPKAGELTRRNERTIDQTLSRTPFLKMERQTDSTSSTKSEIREELPTTRWLRAAVSPTTMFPANRPFCQPVLPAG